MKTNNNQQKHSKYQTEKLNLAIYIAPYEGLEVSERSTASNEVKRKTFVICKWVRLPWSNKPCVKIDYPQIGYADYS
jgi:hypothetical protein